MLKRVEHLILNLSLSATWFLTFVVGHHQCRLPLLLEPLLSITFRVSSHCLIRHGSESKMSLLLCGIYIPSVPFSL